MTDLAKEYRETMDKEVLHSWAKDAVAEIENLRAALKPFAAMGLAFNRDPSDKSPWASIRDDMEIQIGATKQHGWTVTVAEFRAAAKAYGEFEE